MQLLKDVDNLFKKELENIKREFPIIPIETEEYTVETKNFFNYLNFIEKTIPLCPLTVIYSKELKDKLDNNFLDSTYVNYLKNIQNRIENGKSIFHFQSKQIFTKDDCFDMYKINHLHVGNEISEDIHVNSDYILMFIYFKKVVYFIDIIDHPKNEEWFRKDNFKIINNNWKEISDFYKFYPGKNKYNFSDKEAYQLSKMNVLFSRNFEQGYSILPRIISQTENNILNQLKNYCTNNQKWDKNKLYNYKIGFDKKNLIMVSFDFMKKPLLIPIPRLKNYFRYTNYTKI